MQKCNEKTPKDINDKNKENLKNLNKNLEKNKAFLNKYKIKKNDLLNSNLLSNETEINLLLSGIKHINRSIENSNMKFITLIYNSKEDSQSDSMFHLKCDYRNDLLILIKTNDNIIFGGYTKKCFNSDKISKIFDKNSFIFSLNLMKIYYPKENLENLPGNFTEIGYGLSFMNNAIYLGKNLINDIGRVGKKHCGYDFKRDYEINFGKEYFSASAVEIYQIIFDKLNIIQ